MLNEARNNSTYQLYITLLISNEYLRINFAVNQVFWVILKVN